jgi:hypothetical protein
MMHDDEGGQRHHERADCEQRPVSHPVNTANACELPGGTEDDDHAGRDRTELRAD